MCVKSAELALIFYHGGAEATEVEFSLRLCGAILLFSRAKKERKHFFNAKAQRSLRSFYSRTFVTHDVEKYLLPVGIVFTCIGAYFRNELVLKTTLIQHLDD